jgi:hypothetical protein
VEWNVRVGKGRASLEVVHTLRQDSNPPVLPISRRTEHDAQKAIQLHAHTDTHETFSNSQTEYSISNRVHGEELGVSNVLVSEFRSDGGEYHIDV